MDISQQTAELSKYMGKLLRDTFGKGPDNVFVSMGGKYITIYVRNLLSPTEKVLLEKNKQNLFQETRDALLKTILPDIRTSISLITGMEIKEMYFDWSLQNKTAVFIGVSTDKTASSSPVIQDFPGKAELIKEIDEISAAVQKSPGCIDAFMLNNRNIIVVRYDILISIERALIHQGLSREMRVTKRQLEKNELHNSYFERILKTKVDDIFVDWNFELDKSIILFTLRQPFYHISNGQLHSKG
ncbi:Na-translocating system protein MpsC family protein [Bacillaceae bacterium S4-13-58]